MVGSTRVAEERIGGKIAGRAFEEFVTARPITARVAVHVRARHRKRARPLVHRRPGPRLLRQSIAMLFKKALLFLCGSSAFRSACMAEAGLRPARALRTSAMRLRSSSE